MIASKPPHQLKFLDMPRSLSAQYSGTTCVLHSRTVIYPHCCRILRSGKDFLSCSARGPASIRLYNCLLALSQTLQKKLFTHLLSNFKYKQYQFKSTRIILQTKTRMPLKAQGGGTVEKCGIAGCEKQKGQCILRTSHFSR
jgi:hypothetical protein